MKTTEVSCILYGISHKTLDSDFIQEGADNIDLNTETIDGKNTMHSMARAVFQVVQDHTPTTIYVTKNEVQYRISISSNFKEKIVAIADRISLLKQLIE
jgi:hypothetical protein